MRSRELDLIIYCCSRNLPPGGSRLPERPDSIDWDLFMRLAHFHRVEGLVWHGLRELDDAAPTAVGQRLAADAARIAADNLRAAVECVDLADSFAAEGLPLLFVKGLTLGALAYGKIGVKASVDIDLLIAEQDLRAAADLLLRKGYSLHGPCAPASIAGLPAWHRDGKESTWVRPRDGSQVDLHTRLSDQRRLIPSLNIDSPPQSVEVAPGIALDTLRDEELFAYLCVHGSSSAWFRLKWITDLAAFLERRKSGDRARLFRRSQELRAGRAAAQALLLADRLYGSLRGDQALHDELVRDPQARWLAEAAHRQLAGSREPVEPTSRPLGTAMIHLTQLLMLPGWTFPINEAVRQVRAALR